MLPCNTEKHRIQTQCAPWTTLLVTVVRNSCAHEQNGLHMPMVPKSKDETLNSLKLPQDLQGNGRFTTDGDSRTGTFPQMLVTTGDTTCSVNWVLLNK